MAIKKCQLDHGREPRYTSPLAMRIYCRVLVLAACLGVFLLLYFLGSSTGDEPLQKQVAVAQRRENSSTSPSALGRDAAVKFGAKGSRKEGKASLGKVANAKR